MKLAACELANRYLRSSVIGLLIGECTRAFLDNEVQILEGEFEGSLIKHITERPAAEKTLLGR